MLKKFILFLSAATLFVACGSDSNSSSATDDSSSKTQSSESNGGASSACPKNGSGDDTSCSFKKECDTWKYSEQFMGIRNFYIWQDETTVKHEVWMNDYHMDNLDEVLTDQNREDLYKEAMEDCEFYLQTLSSK